MFYTFGICNVLAVLIGSLIAVSGERFNHAQMGPNALPWFNHGGTWADLVIISIVMALVAPCYKQWRKRSIISYGILCGIISFAFHWYWALTMPVPSHIVEPAASGLAKLTAGGWYHLVYMWVVLTIIVLFYFATSGVSRFRASLLLTIYTPIAVMLPGWPVYEITEGAGRVDLPGVIITFGLWAFIWGVGNRRH